MPRKFVIAIIGTGSDVEPAVSKARELGRLVAENGWVLITGGRNKGVMKAANRGAKQAKNCLNIGIINNRVVEISPDVDVAIITDTGEARNNIIVLSADVVIACGVDEAGTASEVALALKNGKHVILLGVNDSARGFFTGIGEDRIRTATSPEEAIRIASELDLGMRGIKALRAKKRRNNTRSSSYFLLLRADSCMFVVPVFSF